MFSVPEMYLWMIPLLPLLSSVVIVAAGRRWFPHQCHIPCIAGAVGACVFSILAFSAVAASADPVVPEANTAVKGLITAGTNGSVRETSSRISPYAPTL